MSLSSTTNVNVSLFMEVERRRCTELPLCSFDAEDKRLYAV